MKTEIQIGKVYKVGPAMRAVVRIDHTDKGRVIVFSRARGTGVGVVSEADWNKWINSGSLTIFA